MLGVFCGILLLGTTTAFLFGGVERSTTTTQNLAPRDALLEEFARVAGPDEFISLEGAAESKFIKELLREGDIEQDELDKMFAQKAVDEKLSANGFVELCENIDDLFEAEDITVLKDSLFSAIGDQFVRTDFDEDDDVLLAAEILASATKLDTLENLAKGVLGEWELIYASSESFAWHQGYTGVSKTTPGGAKFQGLNQKLGIKNPGGAKVATMVESLETNVGKQDLPVTVTGDWSIAQRTEPVTNRVYAVLEIIPRNVNYGFIHVDGQRVDQGWKTMRVLNSLELIYLDTDLRIQKGLKSCFVWKRVAEAL